MFIAMNRFKVAPDSTQAFEAIWLNRESYLHTMPGFVEFHMLRGPAKSDHVLYASHTVWASKADFDNWTRSDAFRAAHAKPKTSGRAPTYLGHPEFEGFEVVQEIKAEGKSGAA